MIWHNFSFWNVVLLAATLFWLIRYTRATEKLAEYQMMPAVDVNMIFDGSVNKTFFWFSNASNIPAFVSIKVTINKDKKTDFGPYRISPNHPPYFKKTSTTLDFLEGKDRADITLTIVIRPAFDKSRIKSQFTKSYRFNKDQFRWDETSWGYPDLPFPG